jgi:small subunit ribosomal protein S8
MYTDLLTRIRNAQAAKKKAVKVPFSRTDLEIAELLVVKKYLSSVEKKGRMPRRVLEIELRYNESGAGAISDVRFVSVPSRRIYAGYRELRLVRQGYGHAVLTTPKGIMTAQDARKQKVGGQILFEIW